MPSSEDVNGKDGATGLPISNPYESSEALDPDNDHKHSLSNMKIIFICLGYHVLGSMIVYAFGGPSLQFAFVSTLVGGPATLVVFMFIRACLLGKKTKTALPISEAFGYFSSLIVVLYYAIEIAFVHGAHADDLDWHAYVYVSALVAPVAFYFPMALAYLGHKLRRPSRHPRQSDSNPISETRITADLADPSSTPEG